MRLYIKEQLIMLLQTMQDLHKEIVVMNDGAQRINLLQDCQQAAIVVGETLESNVASDSVIVSQLEKYCEMVFMLSQEDAVTQDRINELNGIVDVTREVIEEIPLTYHVVFLPYKAAMWDSLESIWLACREDSRCECFVVPIPYCQYDAVSKKREYCYDGYQFPSEVPVIYFQNYSFEKMLPDIAYIHNPYDNYNLVTSVYPDHYSGALKKYVRKLVYVPYYVTTGFISPEHLDLPAYQNMDYMVVQSEYAKESFKGMCYYDKILPFGSPKIDRVIHACRKGKVIPEQWKPILEGKKVLMLNTSLGCFLQDGELYFDKIRYICKLSKEKNEIGLIWRPHPLLEATIKALRPHLLSEYQELVEYFLTEQIGVLDVTPDITNTVVLADGYIGEGGSSVINLFGAVGKPIFILNNYLTGDFTEEEKRRIHITDMVIKENKAWFTTNLYNALLWMDLDTRQVHLAGRVEGQPKWWGAYPFLAEWEDRLYLSPDIASCHMVYHVKSNRFISCSDMISEENLRCRKVVAYGKKVFYLPALNDAIIEFNITTGQYTYHTTCIEELRRGADSREAATYDCGVFGEFMYITAVYTNCVLQFNMNNAFYSLHSIGKEENGYSGIVANQGILWLAEVHNGDIVRWNQDTEEVMIYHMPEEFRSWKYIVGRDIVHFHLIDMGKWIITIPGFCNGMVKVDKLSGVVSMLIGDFWKDAAERTEGYLPELFMTSEFGDKLNDTTILVQRNWDYSAAIVNVEEESYEMFYPALSEEDYAILVEIEDGFEKMENKYAFYRREGRIFSLKGFIEDLANDRLDGVRERQMQELSTLATNLDGSCGEKVHEYITDSLFGSRRMTE